MNLFSRLASFSPVLVVSLVFLFCPMSKAAGKGDFDERAFYVISTEVKGEKVALTFVPGPDPKNICNNPSDAKVNLSKLTKEKNQQWQLHFSDDRSGYKVYAKLSEQSEPDYSLRTQKIVS